MKIPIANVPLQSVLRLTLALFVFVALATLVWLFFKPPLLRAGPLGQSVQPGGSDGPGFEQELREQHQREYIREHSDPSGKVRPEAYRKGIEHVRDMKVAPYIGAKPLGEATSTATN